MLSISPLPPGIAPVAGNPHRRGGTHRTGKEGLDSHRRVSEALFGSFPGHKHGHPSAQPRTQRLREVK